MAKKAAVKLTANFERNLEAVAGFLDEADASLAFDRLLDELSDILIPNLENFPAMGRPFLERTVCSVEVANAIERLRLKLGDGELREYLFDDYVVQYAQFDAVIHLLSIKHHRQLSFDFQSLWANK
ncbi:MAG TPA: type II toxin-antitoxin system RelE/ParE family toxin [Gallionella sp.]|nr:type II toxin-antitoxin system RelE/ParE family toxin [Gallionella sp.]